MKNKKIAIIGTNGIPAKYGGYETLAEQLVKELSCKFDFVVYCSTSTYKKRPKNYQNARLIYLPLKANGWQSVFYDFVSLIHASFKCDTLLVLGAPAGFFFFFNRLFKKNLIINHGGFNEWERPKYKRLTRLWSYYSRKVAVKYATTNIGDNPIIIDSLKKNFNVKGKVIEYGGDHTYNTPINKKEYKENYPFLNSDYFICVARAQIDNNIHIVIDAFKNIPNEKVVIISNWNVTKYGKGIFQNFKNKYKNIILLSAIYDPFILNLLRSNALCYIHSHSFCGTSPSLVEAMNLNLPVISFDVPTNRYTTNGKAFYFTSSKQLENIVSKLNQDDLLNNKADMKFLSKEKYIWSRIATLYSDIF
jgi:glycosyltransferase involved in cell wall biosynthesis